MTLGVVWAQSSDRYIGTDGRLPWYLPEDLARFRALTTGHPVIMGRATWESLPDRFRPLPGRENIVLSRVADQGEAVDGPLRGAQVVGSVDEALTLVAGSDAWVIGGAQVYRAFLPHADRLEITQVDTVIGADTRAPVLGRGWGVVAREPTEGWLTSTTGLRYRFLSFARGTAGHGTARREHGAER